MPHGGTHGLHRWERAVDPLRGKEAFGVRVTRGRRRDGSEFVIKDKWNGWWSAHRSLPDAWIGTTTFYLNNKPTQTQSTSHHPTSLHGLAATEARSPRRKYSVGENEPPIKKNDWAGEEDNWSLDCGDGKGKGFGEKGCDEATDEVKDETKDLLVVSWDELRYGVGRLADEGSSGREV